MPVTVPSQYVAPLRFMSERLGIPYDVAACQADHESSFDQFAVSSAGAEGWLQFEPPTFASWGTGSPFDIWDAARAYVNFMDQLLIWANGDLRKALAAYNAGQGNWQIGLGYADGILSCAGTGDVSTGITTTLPSVPRAAGSSDDWSDHIVQTAGWFHWASNVINATNNAIRRI